MRNKLIEWLEVPLSNLWCFVGWVAGIVIFVSIIRFLGGPSNGDYEFLVYSIWSISHGQLGCAFSSSATTSDPLFPLVSGGIAAVAHIGSSTPFPSTAAMGAHCDRAVYAISQWANRSDPWHNTALIGDLGFLPLLTGIVMVLRQCGRGLRRWEPVTVILIACLPPVWMCVQSTMHPEDLFAVGFGLMAITLAMQRRWVSSGCVMGLALLSQPFAILILIPLVVIPPLRGAARLLGSAAVVLFFVLAPLVLLGSAQTRYGLLHQLQIGILNGTASVIQGGTIVWNLHLTGIPLALVSRGLPIGLSIGVCLFLRQRFGLGFFRAPVLLSIVAASLALRLLFEEALFGYYFMALAVFLTLREVVLGQVRDSIFAWTLIVSVVFCVDPDTVTALYQPWAHDARDVIAVVVLLASSVLSIRLGIMRNDIRRTAIWLLVFGGTLINWNAADNPFYLSLPIWIWQLGIVGSAIILALGPLVADWSYRAAELSSNKMMGADQIG